MFCGGAQQQQPGFQHPAADGDLVMCDDDGRVPYAGQPFLWARPRPHAVQVVLNDRASVDAMGAKADDAGRRHGTGKQPSNASLSAVLGICTVSLAANAITAGAVTPVVAFGLFIALLGGLFFSVASVRGA